MAISKMLLATENDINRCEKFLVRKLVILMCLSAGTDEEERRKKTNIRYNDCFRTFVRFGTGFNVGTHA